MNENKYITENFPRRMTCRSHLDLLLKGMVTLDGSDLFLMSESPAFLSLNGRKVKVTARNLAYQEIVATITDFYGSHTQSALGSGVPIDMSYEFIDEEANKRYRFRVNVSTCLRNGRDALTATFRTIPTDPPNAAQLGIEDEIMDVFYNTDQGLILVVGATGNGKSTTLAAGIRSLLEQPDGHRNLITLEKPIEFVYDSVEKPTSFVTQMEIGRNASSFSEGVHNTLRMAPTHILVGETRDRETAEASLEASITGHAVISTVHANSVSQTLQRLLALFPEESKRRVMQDLMDATKMIIAQRLVPTVDGKRCAIREFLIFDSKVRNYLREAKNITEAADEMVSKYGQSMMDDVTAKLKEGRISKETFERQKYNYETGE